MRKWYLFPALFLFIALLNSCQKEYSLENGSIVAEGTLQSEVTGDCLPKTVAGLYEAGTIVSDSNYIEVSVNVTVPGSYTISTDTANGLYFSATGRFNETGLVSVRLRANGTPLAEGTDNFFVTFGSSTCSVAVITLPEGAGGPAVFTLSGAPGACTAPVIGGVYGQGVALDGTNTVRLEVNVATIGVYNISTVAVNGITFTGTGTFGQTGPAYVTLTGSGTPVQTGPTVIAVPNTQSCSFTVNVVGSATLTINCQSYNVIGVYQVGTPLTLASYLEVQVNVTGAGYYNISGGINGMAFSGVGNFTAAEVGTTILVTLNATGTPTVAGNNGVQIQFNGVGCLMIVPVIPAASVDWSFTDGGTNYSGQSAGATLDSDPQTGAIILEYDGDNAANQALFLTLIDLTGGAIQANETYVTDNLLPTANFGAFQFSTTTSDVTADFTMTPPPKLTITVTEHNTATKFIKGTFAGAARDAVSNAPHTITNGKFQGTYQ